jgi:hypothetical protein
MDAGPSSARGGQQQQQPSMLLMTVSDAAQVEAGSGGRDALLVKQRRLLDLKHRMAAAHEAAAAAAEADTGEWFDTPSVEEENAVMEQLARVTVSLHRGMLKQRAGVSASGGVQPWGASVAPQWQRNGAGLGREGYQDTTDPWAAPPAPGPEAWGTGNFGAGGGLSAQGAVVTVHGTARPHANARSVSELAELAGGLASASVASARLRRDTAVAASGDGEGWEGERRAPAGAASIQGQSRPAPGQAPLSPLVAPIAFPAAELQPGNVRMTLARPGPYVDRTSPQRLRPNALSASAAVVMSVRPVRSPERLPRMLPPPSRAALAAAAAAVAEAAKGEAEEDGEGSKPEAWATEGSRPGSVDDAALSQDPV